MVEQDINGLKDLQGSHRFLPLLLVLFVGSGCSALIYEIVWFQLLQLVIGSSGISLGVLLGTFMGGMCLGSLAFPHLVSVQRHPLRVYALMEFGIGIIAIVVLFSMPYVDRLYVANVGHGLGGILLRAAVCTACLLPPTLLMGATLPAVARWVEMTPQGVSWLGFFYGGNIAGAVLGCLLAGFYLLRLYDMATATYIAVMINVAVALTALGLAKLAPHCVRAEVPTPGRNIYAPGSWLVFLVIALSGLTALGAEVVWTHLLSLLLGGTVYTFSIILAVFLLGLGIGSSIGSVLSRRLMERSSAGPRIALGSCQMLLTAAIAWTAYMLAKSLPYWPIDPSMSMSPWFNFQLDLMRCIWVVLPGAILWGVSFPLALASVASRGQDTGRMVTGVYAANTAGAILGAVGFSMVIIPWVGTQQAQRLMIGLSAMSACCIFLQNSKLKTQNSKLIFFFPVRRVTGAVLSIVLVGLVVFLAWSVSAAPWGLVAYGRFMATWGNRLAPEVTEEQDVPSGTGTPDVFCTYVKEGMNVSVAVTETRSGVRSFHGAGKVQASNDPQDMRLQRMLGHISALLHPQPKSVLVVACGAGVTAGTFVLYPSIQRIVICDIEPLVPKFIAPMFEKENYDVVHDPRAQVICDDGRHFIGTTREKFDIITSDPIDPWVKGCAALNTEQYYLMCREHLNPGGVMTLWIPFYETNPDATKSLIATFFKVFPNGILWSNDVDGEGYDAVLFGQAEPTKIDVDKLQQRLARPDHDCVAQSLEEVGFDSAVSLLATYAGQASRLQEWLWNAQINTDRNLRLQYLAGMWLNSGLGKETFAEILRYYEFPEQLFLGSNKGVQSLKQALEQAGRTTKYSSQELTLLPEPAAQ